MNFLKETKCAIESSGHSPDDIAFIGSTESGHSCTWPEFLLLADFKYDAGFGWAEVASDLVIIFTDGSSMWREEYDGSEWWTYDPKPEIPTDPKPIKTLWTEGKTGWRTLAELHEEKVT